jgi:hypothetical protein
VLHAAHCLCLDFEAGYIAVHDCAAQPDAPARNLASASGCVAAESRTMI